MEPVPHRTWFRTRRLLPGQLVHWDVQPDPCSLSQPVGACGPCHAVPSAVSVCLSEGPLSFPFPWKVRLCLSVLARLAAPGSQLTLLLTALHPRTPLASPTLLIWGTSSVAISCPVAVSSHFLFGFGFGGPRLG